MATDNRLDFTAFLTKIWKSKFLFVKVWIVVFVLACLWIFPQPRYYTCSVSITPESSDSKGGGGLTSLAASFGLNLGNISSSDAIYPQLYPDIFESTDFIVDLFDIQITTQDRTLTTDYYTYISDYQKENPYVVPFKWMRKKIKSLLPKKEEYAIPTENGKRFNHFQLNKKADECKEYIMDAIKCTYSKTTDVVTITVKDQDPLVCALLADSTMAHLQEFIIAYRTKKAKIDYDYYKVITKESKAEYDSARIAYSSYVDKHYNARLSTHQTRQAALESEMNIKQQMYGVMATRMEQARAKIQESTPAFTTLKCATVPLLPAGPKRLMFVLGMLVLATFITSCYVLREEIREWF